MIHQRALLSEESLSETGTHATNGDPRRIVMSAVILTLFVALVGLLIHRALVASPISQPNASNIFFRLYALFERPYLIMLATFAGITAILFARAPHQKGEGSPPHALIAPPNLAQVLLIAGALLVAGVATTHWVMHGLLFSMDEYSAQFQAEIFARGQYAANVPAPWRSLGSAIAPVFVRFDERSGRMMSMYLPVYSALKAPFVVLGVPTLLNPLLSAMSVIVLAGLARRLWPADGTCQWSAIALFATSAQAIATSGTGYAMPAHLFLNLAWLWLYLRGDTLAWCGALVIGFLELGLHNPFPHALFVAPFLFTLVRQRRWSRVSSALLAYGVGGAIWLAWLRAVNPATGAASTGLFTLFTLPDLGTVALHAMNISLLFTWQAPVLGTLVLVAVAHPRQLHTPFSELALGVLVTLLFFMLYPNSQGHGWGYRYIYQLLGSLALLGAAAIPTLRTAVGGNRTQRWLAAGLVSALMVQIPLRLRDIESFVRPFAAGYAFARSRDAQVVLLHGDSIWYGRDIVRNDPYLTPPILVRTNKLPPGASQLLTRQFPDRVVDLADGEFLRLGMTPQRIGN